MEIKYIPSKIEPKWQRTWEKDNSCATPNLLNGDNKKYVLDMFPYPSGAGLHVGHTEGFTATDVYSRFLRMNGYRVLHPMGWDAFGLPAENYAINTGVHPRLTTQKNIANFRRQLKSLGLSYDWGKEVNTSDPEYYKWTQWLFLKLYEKGLTYRKNAFVNWCSSCQTVLANEQVKEGKCERCKNDVVQKNMEQWFFRITQYAEDLLSDLENLDWPEPIKAMQRNWIGKSEGATIKFKVKSLKLKVEDIDVFTTRPDTLFGATYLVIAPDSDRINNLKLIIDNWEQVEKYIIRTKKKTDLQRTDLNKEKTGVELKGIVAVNPINGKEIPIWIADYVLSGYGTGAIMAVPAHDERDFEFAKKYKLPIIQVIAKKIDYSKSFLMGGNNISDEDLQKLGIQIIDKENNRDRKIIIPEKSILDYEKLISDKIEDNFWNEYVGKNIIFIFKINKQVFRYELNDATEESIQSKALKVINDNSIIKEKKVWQWIAENEFYTNEIIHTDYGIVINSKDYSGMTSEDGGKKIVEDLKKNNLAEFKTQFKLRDWLISRQRYWGAPIPIIYCRKCLENDELRIKNNEINTTEINREKYAIIPVPEDQLPVELPTDVDFKPTGESPLVHSRSFHNVKCPKCHSPARRESDTMDTFVDSSWYFLRYIDPSNENEFAAKELIEKWMPVDMYVGGAEHAVLHLLYSRFIVKSLHDLNYISFNEPFKVLRNQGLILGEDSRKMSKSLGNVANPDDVIRQYGADTLRLYEMFMGPFEDAKPWSTRSIIGSYRFLEKVWLIGSTNSFSQDDNIQLQNLLNKLIIKIESDIKSFALNTAISSLMSFLNEVVKSGIGVKQWRKYLVLLSPFAPHICEELWQISGGKESIFNEKWVAPADNISSGVFNITVQINNKMRGIIIVTDINAAKQDMIKLIKENHDIGKHLTDDYKIIKYIPGEKIIIMVS